MNLWKKHKDLLQFLVILAGYCLIAMLLELPCPIKFVTGISCPGCGMTRALVSAIRLDFAAAFHYHPLWILLPPVALLWLCIGERRPRLARVGLIAVAVLFLVTYVCRFIWGDRTVLVFAPQDGLIGRIAAVLYGFFT